MTIHESIGKDRSVGELVELRSATIDDLSSIRYVHATALKAEGSISFSEEELAAAVAHIYSPAYADALFTNQLNAAWVAGQLVGTAAWSPSDDQGSVARIRGVFVVPLFQLAGVGRRLVADAETRAARAGFRIFTTEATRGSVPFFERLGYEVTSHGVNHQSGPAGLPVAFLRKSLAAATVVALPPAFGQPGPKPV